MPNSVPILRRCKDFVFPHYFLRIFRLVDEAHEKWPPHEKTLRSYCVIITYYIQVCKYEFIIIIIIVIIIRVVVLKKRVFKNGSLFRYFTPR